MAQIIKASEKGVVYIFASKEEADDADKRHNDFLRIYFPELSELVANSKAETSSADR